MNKEEEHTISEREKKAFQEAKKIQPSRDRPELTEKQQLLFLDLVSSVATPAVFRRKLDMDPSDVEYYKQALDVQGHEEARVKLRNMKIRLENKENEAILRNIKEAREAEALAERRLKEFEQSQKDDQAVPTRPSQAKIAEEDAERQRRFQDQQADNEPTGEWRLDLPTTDAQRDEAINRFRKDIQYRGINFCREKYGTDAKSIRAEASRLGLKINWDIVRR